MSEAIRVVVVEESAPDRERCAQVLRPTPNSPVDVRICDSAQTGLLAVAELAPQCVVLSKHSAAQMRATLAQNFPGLLVLELSEDASSSDEQEDFHRLSRSTLSGDTLVEAIHQLAIGDDPNAACGRPNPSARVSGAPSASESRDLGMFSRGLVANLDESVGTMQSFLRMLSAHRTNGDAVLEYVNIMTETAGDLRRLVETLREFGEVHVPKDAEQQSSEDVTAVIEDCLSSLPQRSASTNVDITVGELPSLHCDPLHLRTIVSHLVQNAVDHRGDQPVRIKISGDDAGGQSRFCVSDNGPGMPVAYTKRIFDPFVRFSNDRVGGCGLGLAICRRIVEAYDGTIWCESVRGQGTAVYFTLPCGRKPSQDDALQRRASVRMPGQRVRILMVEDNEADVHLARSLLRVRENDRLEFVSVPSGDAALAALRATDARLPDLILLDINMPGMSGFEVVEQLQADARLASVPVVLCTSRIDSDEEQRSRSLGVAGYMEKPVQKAKLRQYLSATFH